MLSMNGFALKADTLSDNPIAFVTIVPNPSDFGTLAATFGNHVANPNTAFRGGNLWIRYPDGSLKNITQTAGYGTSGIQGLNAIAVRDPSVHWDGNKIIFSMVIGAPTQQYQVNSYRWQLYEVTGIGKNETPIITKVPNQPSSFNNVAPIYASDDSIIFVTDKPRDNSVLSTYPQLDEYESSPVNSGLWKLNTQTGESIILDHAPSGNFNPIIDSFGRIIFTRWDHLQRDQQNVGVSRGAFNYASETSSVKLNSAAEIYPEPRSTLDPDYKSTVNLFTINQFFPWMMNQDGTELETLNHVGRQEIGIYSERSFNDDPNVEEFYGQYTTGQNQNEFSIMLHIKENPLQAGTYYGTNCQEFGTHSGGQIISLTGPPGLNPNNMQVNYLTHPDTAGASDSPSINHTGLYRDPLPLSNGNLIAVHTSNTRQDNNIGSSTNPLSRYSYRIKLLTKSGNYFLPSTPLTSGISKSVSFWDPDNFVSYSGELWEMMPVEIKSRTRPTSHTTSIPEIESNLITSMGINIDELKSYLQSQNLALVISRNLTSRDKNDRQQPTNLRVAGTNTQSLPSAGKIYDISRIEFFQGDLIRGYYPSYNSGRRVIAQRLHSVPEGVNPSGPVGSNEGSLQIANDGSMAAFVPAKRALSWQMVDQQNNAVVKERYWVTFQPGEIRVCASCHGVNTTDHLGNPVPTNSPLALAQLMAYWKNLPPPTVVSPTPTPNPTPIEVTPPSNSPPSPPSANDGTYLLDIKGDNIKPKARFYVDIKNKPTDSIFIKAQINSLMCGQIRRLKKLKQSRTLKGVIPYVPGANLKLSLFVDGEALEKTSDTINISNTISKKSKKPVSINSACKSLLKSLR